MAVVTSALIAAAVTAASAAAAGLSTYAIIGLAVASFAMNQYQASAQKRAEKKMRRSLSSLDEGRNQSVRQSIEPREIVYGVVRKGGFYTLIEQTEKRYLHIVLVLATHKVFAIKNIFLNDEIITEQQIDASGNVVAGKFSGKVRIKKYLGTDTQSADPDLLAAGIADINSNFRLRGCTYIYVRLDYDQNVFPSGIPNISADVWGKECFDPRTSTVKFTTNPVLYLYDFLTNTRFYGKALPIGDIDTASFISEANICDAIVNTKTVTLTVSAVDVVANSFAFADATIGLQTGDRVQINSTGDMPAGLVAGTNYYAIVDCTRKSPSVRLSSSLNNALAGTAIDISSAGSGVITIIKNGEPRYTANGVFDTATTDAEIISKLCSSLKGNIFAPGGYWYVRAGSWNAPTVSFNEDNFVEGITLNTKISRSDRFNSVRGTYISPLHDDQATDYPFIKSAGYEAEDLNSRILADFDLPFTTRSQTAQRLAKIHLLENRRQISLSVTVDLSGLKVQAGDIVNISYARYGWVNKTFRVECWTLTSQEMGAGSSCPALVVKLELREIDANIYLFDELTEEVIPNKPPSTTLSSAFAVEPPTGLTLFAGETELDVSGDGTVISRIKTVFTAPSNSFINNYEIFWKEDISANWLIETIPNSASPITIFLVPVIDGKNYQVKVRSINQLGVKSDFTSISNITVIGKSAPPDNVTSFTVQQNGGVVIFKWVAVSNTDLAGYTIKYGSTNSSWAELKTLTEVTRGTNVTSADVPPGVHKFAIKARDTSGNESVSEITQIIEVTNSNDIIDVAEEWGHWNGTKTNFIKNPLTGDLVCEDSLLAGANNNQAVFDNYIQTAYSNYEYISPEKDLGFKNNVRVWVSHLLQVFPSQPQPKVIIELDHKDFGGVYDGYENWSIGFINNRYFKSKLRLFELGAGYLTSFKTVYDLEERTESGTVSIAAGGTVITFAKQFHRLPVEVKITPQGSSALLATYENLTVNSVKINLFNSSGASVAGTASYSVTGV